MSDPLTVLERLACEPYLDAGNAAALADALDVPARDALQRGDGRALAALLGRPAAMACAIAAPDDHEPSPDELPCEEEPHAPDIPGEAD